MRKFEKRFILLLLAVLLAAALTACGDKGEPELDIELPPEPADGVLIYAALNPATNELNSAVSSFNSSHTDVQIEVRDYSDENGTQRLLLELMAGRVPDIMELHQLGENGDISAFLPNEDPPEDEYWMPYQRLVETGYLEDLWPYIDADPELGRDLLLETPLKAAEVNGGLYMLFNEVSITTLVGAERVVGDRCGWTFEELMDAFSDMPPDATILRYSATQKEIFSRLFSISLGRYVDWEKGQCTFDSQEFRSMVEFLKTFPTEFETTLSAEALEDELFYRLWEGNQMLEARSIVNQTTITKLDAFFNERVSFPGYPTADASSGSYFRLKGRVMAMSSTCRYKDAAWEFMRQHLRSRYNNSGKMEDALRQSDIAIPINRKDYELGSRVAVSYLNPDDPNVLPLYTCPNGPILGADAPDADDIQRFDELVSNTTQIYWPDDTLTDIVWDAIGPCLAGNKTLDETVALIQNRVQLYVNEQK